MRRYSTMVCRDIIRNSSGGSSSVRVIKRLRESGVCVNRKNVNSAVIELWKDRSHHEHERSLLKFGPVSVGAFMTHTRSMRSIDAVLKELTMDENETPRVQEIFEEITNGRLDANDVAEFDAVTGLCLMSRVRSLRREAIGGSLVCVLGFGLGVSIDHVAVIGLSSFILGNVSYDIERNREIYVKLEHRFELLQD
jgi:hypothetical protein